MHDVAWRGMWICVRSKDAQKQLARTSLNKQGEYLDSLNSLANVVVPETKRRQTEIASQEHHVVHKFKKLIL